MNEQEAIVNLKYVTERWANDEDMYSDTMEIEIDQEFINALYTAKESLEKQIPKKPIYSEFDDNGNDEIIPYKAICPVCKNEFEFGTWNEEENHHCVCGQKLDWSV